jgi:Rrf2 family protein
MAVNTRTEYALRVLIELAEHGMLSAQKICDTQKLPKKYIEHLLAMLKTSNIVKSSAGSLGGYSLSRKPDEINFRDILSAVEDASFDTSCVPNSGRHCLGSGCKLSLFFHELNGKISEVLGAYSLSDIHKYFKEGHSDETR